MVIKLFQALKNVELSSLSKLRVEQVRHGHRLRGKPPYLARTLQQRLEEMNRKDPETSFKVDIGFAVPKLSPKMKSQLLKEIKAAQSNPQKEKLARHRALTIDLEKERETRLQTTMPAAAQKIAEHYGIFNDLFGDAYFTPIVNLDIKYQTKADDDSFDALVPVFTGNVIKPEEAGKAPRINFEAKSDDLWTLIMSTPDGNLQNSENEYCHWFIGNIPGNEVQKGEQIIDYMQPIPSRGIGYYRYIFVLYKQNQRIDYTEYKKAEPCLSLAERDWNTLQFYRQYQDNLTPAGLAFYQSDWDSSVMKFYHTKLDAKEPIFQYDFPEPHKRRQTWFPVRQPFNLYLDNFRDPKQIMKEFLLRKLKNVHPFRGPKPPLKYPNAVPYEKDLPTWLKLEMKKERLGWGRINDLK